MPTYMRIHPTMRCNLKCRTCIQYRHNPDSPSDLMWFRKDQELSLDAWTHLFEELVKWRPLLFITGGEPLLYPHILEFIEEAKKRKLLIHLQTNGILLDRLADHLVSLGVEMVTVSLDGPPTIHDYLRGEGNFHRSAKGAQTLAEARRRQNSPSPLLDIRCTISKDNLACLGEMVTIAQELDADLLQFSHTFFTTSEMVDRHNRFLSPKWAQAEGLEVIHPSIHEGGYYESQIGPEDLPLLLDSLQDLQQQAQGRIKVQFSPNLTLDSIAPYYLDLEHPFPQVCRSLWKTCRIVPDGTVSPCLNLVMGNITEEPLKVIWKNAKMRRWRKIISQNLFPGCVRCCHRSFTNGFSLLL